MRPIVALASESPLQEPVYDILWNWMLKNWSKLYEQLSVSLTLLGRVVNSCISGRIGTAFVVQVENWAQGNGLDEEAKNERLKQIKAVNRPLEQGLETIRSRSKWVQSENASVKAWVESLKLEGKL